MTPHGAFHWNELMTHDVEAAKAFYATTLGWTFEGMPMPEGTYWVAKSGEKVVGGVFPMSGEMFKDVPENWFSYVAVDDIDQRVVLAKKAGAKICREPFDIPGIGRIAILETPTGAMQGWMTPAPMGDGC